MDSSLLSLSRMARRLGVTQKWLRDEADANRVPCLRANRRLLFAIVAVERALVERASGGCKSEEVVTS
jgi:hypothetical protein